MKRDLIKTIHIDKANLEHIAKTGNINGTLLIEIERVMTEFAQLQANGAEQSESNCNIPCVSGSSLQLIEQLLQNDLKAAGKLTRLELDEQSEHELGLSIGRTKLALKEIQNYR